MATLKSALDPLLDIWGAAAQFVEASFGLAVGLFAGGFVGVALPTVPCKALQALR